MNQKAAVTTKIVRQARAVCIPICLYTVRALSDFAPRLIPSHVSASRECLYIAAFVPCSPSSPCSHLVRLMRTHVSMVARTRTFVLFMWTG